MNRNSQRTRRQSGFTLIEILIVIAIIGIIAGIVASKVFGNKDRAYYKLAETDMQTLAAKVGSFEEDTGALPGSLEDLVRQPGGVSGWLGPYAKEKELKDPWGTPYQYRTPGQDGPFDLISLGADRKTGGEALNADLRHQN